jgi:hypothetical protein
VFARHEEDALGARPLQNLIDRVELFRLRQMADVGWMVTVLAENEFAATRRSKATSWS